MPRLVSSAPVRGDHASAILNTVTDSPVPEFLQPRTCADGPIVLAEPDPRWVEQYALEERRMQDALGSRAIQIEHAGSTSVSGLAAKPVIDILLVVPDSSEEAAYLPDLEAAGYVLYLREPDLDQHRLLRDHDPDVQVHVFSVGTPAVQRMLMFRDRLRAHPDERDLYQRSKRVG